MTTTLTSSTLFQRAATVQVGDLLIECGGGTGLDVAFTVRKGIHITKGSSKPLPNTCDLKIWNLTEDHARQLEATTTPSTPQSANPDSGVRIIPCVISAGYVGRQSIIFAGELRSANTTSEGPDRVTELATGDGDTALAQTRLTVALGPGTTGAIGLRKILVALGVGQGNLARALTYLAQHPLSAQIYVKGAILKGSAAEIMTDFCRATDLDWSIQNGAAQFTQRGKPLDGDAVLIDPEHGMIGSPTVDTKGILSVTTLMIPDIKPGAKIDVRAANVKGGYRILSVQWSGSTAAGAQEWYAHIEAARF